MTDQELTELLGHGEADRVERKESIADTGAIRQAICAFANDLPDHRKPGVVFIGVKDNGECPLPRRLASPCSSSGQRTVPSVDMPQPPWKPTWTTAPWQ
jgi:hypothetical protein